MSPLLLCVPHGSCPPACPQVPGLTAAGEATGGTAVSPRMPALPGVVRLEDAELSSEGLCAPNAACQGTPSPHCCQYLAGWVGSVVLLGGSQPASSAPPGQSMTPSHLRDAVTQVTPHQNSPVPQDAGVTVTARGTLGRERGGQGEEVCG